MQLISCDIISNNKVFIDLIITFSYSYMKLEIP